MKTLLAVASLAVAAAPPAATAATALAVHQGPALPQLLVAGDRVELGYSTDSSGVKSLAGMLFVTSYADLRIGPDGKLYGLSTSPTNGVTISRYSLQP